MQSLNVSFPNADGEMLLIMLDPLDDTVAVENASCVQRRLRMFRQEN